MRNDYDADERERDEDDYEGDGLRWMSVVVVLLVVLGFVSLAWYAYRSGTSAASEGDVPTIQAEAGPLKVAPTDPGGMDIPNQDKTIYEAVAQGEHSGKTEVLTEAPEEPVTIPAPSQPKDTKETQVYRKPADQTTAVEVEGDAAQEQPQPEAAPVTQVETSTVEPQPEPAAKPEDAAADSATSDDAEALAAKATENVVAEVKTETPAVAPEPEPMAVSPQQPAPPVVNALSAAQKAARDAQKAKTELQATSAQEPKMAVSAGGSGVQLAASKTREDAEKVWGRLVAKFPSILGGRAHSIVAADVAGKGTFYRVRATGLSGTSAADMCRQLKARGQDCMVVK